MIRFLKFLNSPLMVWLLTVVIAGAATAIFTQLKSCKTQLEANEIRLLHLDEEITTRKERLYRAIMKATSEADMKNALELASRADHYVYADLKDKTLTELEEEFVRVGQNAFIDARIAQQAESDANKRQSMVDDFDFALAYNRVGGSRWENAKREADEGLNEVTHRLSRIEPSMIRSTCSIRGVVSNAWRSFF